MRRGTKTRAPSRFGTWCRPGEHFNGQRSRRSYQRSVLIGAVLAEQHDEWAEQRRYMGLEILAKVDAIGASEAVDATLEEVMLPATAPVA